MPDFLKKALVAQKTLKAYGECSKNPKMEDREDCYRKTQAAHNAMVVELANEQVEKNTNNYFHVESCKTSTGEFGARFFCQHRGSGRVPVTPGTSEGKCLPLEDFFREYGNITPHF